MNSCFCQIQLKKIFKIPLSVLADYTKKVAQAGYTISASGGSFTFNKGISISLQYACDDTRCAPQVIVGGGYHSTFHFDATLYSGITNTNRVNEMNGLGVTAGFSVVKGNGGVSMEFDYIPKSSDQKLPLGCNFGYSVGYSYGTNYKVEGTYTFELGGVWSD